MIGFFARINLLILLSPESREWGSHGELKFDGLIESLKCKQSSITNESAVSNKEFTPFQRLQQQ